MKKVSDTYTTTEKKTEDKNKPIPEQTEQNKTEITNDAYAICDFIEGLINKLEHARVTKW